MKALIIITINILLSGVFVYANKIPTYEVGGNNTELTNFTLGLIVDSTKQKQIDEISKAEYHCTLTNSRFVVSSTDVYYWFVFKLKNSSQYDTEKVLGFDEVFMETADLYYQTEDGWNYEKNGMSQPINLRRFADRYPTFHVSIKSGETKTIYLKVHSNFLLVFGVFVDEILNYAINEQTKTMWYWGYFGAAIAIILYNLLLLFYLRERLYLYYVIYAFFLVLFASIYSGYFLYVCSNVKALHMLDSSIAITALFMTLFTRELLRPKNISNWIDRVLIIIAIAYATISVLIIIDIYFYQWLVMFAMPSLLFLLITGVICIIKKVPLSKFYVIAMSAYLIGLFMVAAVNMGLLPFNTITRYGFMIGSLIEMLFFSFALGYRIKLLQDEKNRTKEEIQEQLETEVKNRTKELSQLSSELEIANNNLIQQISEKDIVVNALKQSENKLFELHKFKSLMTGMIVHDLKNPLNTIVNIDTNNITQREFVRVKNIGTQMLNLVLNILDINKYEDTDIKLVQETVETSSIIDLALTDVKYLAGQKNIRFQKEINQNNVFVDTLIVKRILINLLTNAIKYSDQNSIIVINTEIINSEEIKITITDAGEGIPEEEIHLVFEKFTQFNAKDSGTVRSTGLGLAFCKLATEALNGKIGVVSEKDNGCSFWFTLPISNETSISEKESIHKQESVVTKIVLSENEKQLLEPSILKLRKFDIFAVTNVKIVVDEIKQHKIKNLTLWAEQIENCIETYNKEEFKKLIKC